MLLSSTVDVTWMALLANTTTDRTSLYHVPTGLWLWYGGQTHQICGGHSHPSSRCRHRSCYHHACIPALDVRELDNRRQHRDASHELQADGEATEHMRGRRREQHVE